MKKIVQLRKLIKELAKEFIEYKKNFDSIQDNNKELILVGKAIDLITNISEKMAMYQDDKNIPDENLYSEIASLSEEELDKIYNDSFMKGPVSILRCTIARKFQNNKINSANELLYTIKDLQQSFNNKITEEFVPYINKSDFDVEEYINSYPKKDAFLSWGAAYRVLLPFVYSTELKYYVWEAMEVVIKKLLQDLNLTDSWECKNSQGWHHHVRSYYGFEGPSNFGAKRAVIMLHPKEIPDHKNSAQLVCYFSGKNIDAGFDMGTNVRQYDATLEINPYDYIKRFRKTMLEGTEYENKEFEAIGVYKKIYDLIAAQKEFAQNISKRLMELRPDIKSNYVAEGNAEYDSTGYNIYDLVASRSNNEDNTDNNNFSEEKTNDDTPDLETSQAKITDESKISTSKIYSNIKSDEDCLGRTEIADYISNNLIKNKLVEPLNIGIYGDWGSGKTQVINLIKENIKNSPEEVEYVDFDAWQYNDQEHIWAALVTKILNKCMEKQAFYFDYILHKFCCCCKNNWKEWEMRFLGLGIIYILAMILIPPYLESINSSSAIWENIFINHGYYVLLFTILIAIIPDIIKLKFVNIDQVFVRYFKTPDYTEHLGFRGKISSLIQYALNYLSKTNIKPDKKILEIAKQEKIDENLIKSKRIVLFIDNLDRCSSGNIKQILDSICQFLEMCNSNCTKNIITVFAMDRKIIIDALEKEGVPCNKVNTYLEKIINLPIYLTNNSDIEELLIRLYGEEENDIKYIIRESYAKRKFIPRRMANLRYLCDMNRKIYNENLPEEYINNYLYD